MLKRKLIPLLLLITFQFALSQQKTYLLSEVTTIPEFPGGSEMLKSFISSNFEMPEDVNVDGQIEISFKVDAKGKLSNFEIVKNLGGGTGEEAVRIFTLSPRWIPGKLADGSAVSVYFILTIKLQSR